jgi:hypothetical protein
MEFVQMKLMADIQVFVGVVVIFPHSYQMMMVGVVIAIR